MICVKCHCVLYDLVKGEDEMKLLLTSYHVSRDVAVKKTTEKDYLALLIL